MEDGRPLKVCIEEMVSVQDFCLFISDEQNLYAMGQNLRGMLGLGPEVQSTGSRAIMVSPKFLLTIMLKRSAFRETCASST